MIKIRIEFEKFISTTDPKSLLQQRLIMNDFGFYQRALMQKISEGIDNNLITPDDSLVIRYDLNGQRHIDVKGIMKAEIGSKIKVIAERIFPNQYQKAKL